jgi:hypothetical protein
MSSELLGAAQNVLKGNLGGAWDINKGYADAYTDLGIARRFGGAAAAYSLRDIGAMNGSVVRVRRSPEDTTDAIDDEERFSANQVQDGTLERWVNGKLESTLPADVATAQGSYSLRKVKASYSDNAVRIRRIDNTEVDVAFDSDDKVSTSSSITNVTSGDVDNTSETTLGNFLQGEANVRALFNSSAYFPSDSDYFTLGSGLTLSGAFTISYDVVFTDSFNTNKSRIFQDDAGNDLLTFTASNVCKFRVNGTVRTMPALSITLQLGRKYSMIFARDGSGNYTLTIDGVQVSSVSGTDTDDFLIQRIGFRNRGSISNININNGQHIYVGDGAENSNWTDTGSGTTTNATKVGTPVAFTGQGIDSFVHTWYNQSGDGSNGATQATSTKQPKIASGGALLDHLLFDGTDDFLADTNVSFEGAITLACLSEKAANGLYPISAARQGATNRFFGLQEQASASAFLPRNNATGATVTTTASGNTRLTFARTNSDTDQAVASMGRALSTGTNDYGNTPTASLINHFVIGALTTGSGGTPDLGTWNGKIFEAIGYQTDETDNKFKIESNINNYYGLYNDANEFASNETAFRFLGQRSGGTSTSSDLNGFTLDVQTASGYAGAKFASDVTSGTSIYVSFNCSFDSGSPSPKVALRDIDSSLAGGVRSNEVNLTEGFNSFTLTSNNDTASGIVWSEGDDNVIFSVTDIKVSRIARNGFVETWYDQSGNGEDMTQGTAGSQPSIVINGGQVKDYKGNNSIDFVSGSTRVLDKSGTTTAKTCIVVLDEDSSGSAERAILGFSASTSFMRLDTGTDLELKAGGVTSNYRAVPTDVTSLYFWYTNGTDEDKLFANNVEEGDTTSNTPPNLPFTRIGARNSDADPYNSRITEVIAFAEDLSSDRTVLQDDVNNNYNIF